MTQIYRIDRLKKKYGDRTVLDIETLSFERGKVTGLLGPNGAGKTTLLEIMAFLQHPDSGNLFFKKEMVDFSGRNLLFLRRRAVLLQQHPIMFSTSVMKNVEFPLRVRKKSKKERERAILDLLTLVGMEGFKEAQAHRLSGGETQRVAIAQALACSPDVILMDEPTVSVDVENQITIERIIKEINREKGISVIMTTHDMIQASRVMDDVFFIYEGRLSRSSYENIFSGRIEADREGRKYCIILDKYRFPIKSGNPGPVKISINPETIKLHENGEGSKKDCLFKGRLIQVTDEESHIRLLVDIGIPLKVFLQKKEYKNLGLKIGEPVGFDCPPEAIEIV